MAGRPPVKKIAVVLAWCHSAEWMTEPTAEQCAHTECKVRESAEERDRKQQDEYFRARMARRHTQKWPI